MADNRIAVTATITAADQFTDWLIVECGRDSVGRFALRVRDSDDATIEVQVKRPGEADAAAVVLDSFQDADAFMNGEFHATMMVRAGIPSGGDFTSGSIIVDIWRP